MPNPTVRPTVRSKPSTVSRNASKTRINLGSSAPSATSRSPTSSRSPTRSKCPLRRSSRVQRSCCDGPANRRLRARHTYGSIALPSRRSAADLCTNPDARPRSHTARLPRLARGSPLDEYERDNCEVDRLIRAVVQDDGCLICGSPVGVWPC
jgi:hypothetical protein